MGKIIIHYILWILSLLSNSTTDTDEIIRKTGSSFSKSYELNYKGVTEEIERVAERTVNIRPRKLYGWEDIYKITLGRGWKMHQRQEIQCIAKELENTTGNNSCKTKKWEHGRVNYEYERQNIWHVTANRTVCLYILWYPVSTRESKLDSDYIIGKTFKQNESQQMLIGTINDKK